MGLFLSLYRRWNCERLGSGTRNRLHELSRTTQNKSMAIFQVYFPAILCSHILALGWILHKRIWQLLQAAARELAINWRGTHSKVTRKPANKQSVRRKASPKRSEWRLTPVSLSSRRADEGTKLKTDTSVAEDPTRCAHCLLPTLTWRHVSYSVCTSGGRRTWPLINVRVSPLINEHGLPDFAS